MTKYKDHWEKKRNKKQADKEREMSMREATPVSTSELSVLCCRCGLNETMGILKGIAYGRSVIDERPA